MWRFVLVTLLSVGCGSRTGLSIEPYSCPRQTPRNANQPIGYGDILREEREPAAPGTYYNYFVARDGRRYIIPDGGAFFPGTYTAISWNLDSAMTRLVPTSELTSLQLGGNVILRPGTFLIRLSYEPTVYAITPGGVRHRVPEAGLSELYGSDWAARTITVTDAYFALLTPGDALSIFVHPEGSLISFASNPTQPYYIDRNHQRRLITPEGFCANRFDWRFVLELEDHWYYPDGPPVTAREPELADPVTP